MVFGLGKGKIGINLEKASFSPGETIKGKVSLELKKPIQAKALKVVFVGEKIVHQWVRNQIRNAKYPLLRNEIQLDGENEYYGNIYPFELKIPDDALFKSKHWGETGEAFIGGKAIQLGEKTTALQQKAKKFVQAAQDKHFQHMDVNDVWFVEAKLEVPLGTDVKEKIEISLVEDK